MNKCVACLVALCLLNLAFLKADTNAVYVDESGKVGININEGESPVADLDVKGTVNISESLKLEPVNALPQNPVHGTMALHGGELKIFLGSVWNKLKMDPILPASYIHETFEDGLTNFTGMTVVDKPAAPSGAVGAKVGKTNFKATTTRAVVKYHTFNNLDKPLNGAKTLDLSLKLGTGAQVHGDCEVRFVVFFDNGKKQATSYKNVTVAHATEVNMRLYEWKGIAVNGDDATTITKVGLHLRQKQFPFTSKGVYVDEIKVEPAL